MVKNNNELTFQFRWKNFRSLKNSTWIDIKPLTIFIGPNNSGKTSLFYPLLILKQTIESMDTTLALKTKGRYVKVGDYENLIHNHDTNNSLILELSWPCYSCEKNENGKKDSETLTQTISLTFEHGEKNDCELQSYEICTNSQSIVKRDLDNNGKYTFNFLKPIKKEIDNNAYEIILDDLPEHFVFNIDTIIQRLLRDASSNDDKKGIKEMKITGNFASLLNVLQTSSLHIKKLLNHIDYVGPIRQHPKRHYESIGEKAYSVGPLGEYTSDILLQMQKGKKLEPINDWLHKFNFFGDIDCHEHTPGIFSIEWNDKSFGKKINIADMGFGASQILPLITQGVWMDENRFLIAEQPEIHLNPKLQRKLADFFVDMVESKKRVILETHSEHLLLRLRTLVAKGDIDASDIALYFIENDGKITSVKNVPILDDGHINGNEWPKGFFGESLKESMELAEAQFERKKQNAT